LTHELSHFETYEDLKTNNLSKIKGIDKDHPNIEDAAIEDALFRYFEELKAITSELKQKAASISHDKKNAINIANDEATVTVKEMNALQNEIRKPNQSIGEVSQKSLYPFVAALNTSFKYNPSLKDLSILGEGAVQRDISFLEKLKSNIRAKSKKKLTEAEVLAHPTFLEKIEAYELQLIYNENDVSAVRSVALMSAALRKTESFYRFLKKKNPQFKQNLRQYSESQLLANFSSHGTDYQKVKVIFDQVYQHMFPSN
jgi:hypothetical protein